MAGQPASVAVEKMRDSERRTESTRQRGLSTRQRGQYLKRESRETFGRNVGTLDEESWRTSSTRLGKVQKVLEDLLDGEDSLQAHCRCDRREGKDETRLPRQHVVHDAATWSWTNIQDVGCSAGLWPRPQAETSPQRHGQKNTAESRLQNKNVAITRLC